MGTLLTVGCIGAFVLAVLFAAAVALFLIVGAVRKRTAPPPMIARPIAPEPAAARYQPAPERDFGEQAIDWQEKVKREKERAEAKANLEVLFGIRDVMAKSSGVAAPKAE